MADSHDSSAGRNLATFLALIGMIGIGLGLLSIMVMIMPGMIKMVFIPFIFALFIFLHYVVWGRRMIAQKELYDARLAEQEAADRAATAPDSEG